MEIMDFLKTWEAVQALDSHVHIDRFKWVCMSHGVSESQAVHMYRIFKEMASGRYPCENGRRMDADKIQKIFSYADEAKTLYAEHASMIELVGWPVRRPDSSIYRVLVVWSSPEGEKNQSVLPMHTAESFVAVGEMVRNGCTIHNIIFQEDIIHDTRDCMSMPEDKRGKESLPVFDGDVFYVGPDPFWSSSVREAGIYLCHQQAYARLQYNPGKGYMRKGKPDIDEDVSRIEIDSDAFFNHHILTMAKYWSKIGNIYVDNSFLTEKADE